MALWLQAGALLVILAIPGVNANPEALEHLCGSDLVDAIDMVCGLTHDPHNSLYGFYGFLPSKSRKKNEVADIIRKIIRKSGIVEQCCYKPCSILEVENYCNYRSRDQP